MDDVYGWVTLTEVDTYAEQQIGSGVWATARALSPSPCVAALLSAARRISQEDFVGRKTDATQAFAWPRSGVRDEDGYWVDPAQVPERVKRAQMKLAFALLADETFLAADELAAFAAVSVGPLSVTLRPPRPAGSLPDDVRRELLPFLGGSAVNFRLVRG